MKSIRKKTDPCHEKDEDLIVVVYGQENPGLIHRSALVKHMFVSGIPGAGKTTSVQNLVTELMGQRAKRRK
jgi:type IV secretory pathway VirB4 component